jgi:hypothetical protein
MDDNTTRAAAGGLEHISTPDQLPTGARLAECGEREFHIAVDAAWDVDLYWLHETASGLVLGAMGLRARAATTARLTASLRGQVEATVCRDDDADGARLRVRLSPAAAPPLHLATTVQTKPPGASDELLVALLGIHPMLWIRDALGSGGSLRWKRLAEYCRATSADFETLMSVCRMLGATAEAALWRATARDRDYDCLRDWIAWLATACPGPEALARRVQQTLVSDAAFAGSPVAAWIEAIHAGSLATLAATPRWSALASAALTLHTLLSNPGAERILRRLRARLRHELDPAHLWPWAQRGLTEALGASPTAATLPGLLAPWRAFRDRVYQAAQAPLATHFRAELAALWNGPGTDGILADVSVPFTPSGLELYRRVLGGNLAALASAPPEARPRHGLLTHHTRRPLQVGLCIPFLDRRAWAAGSAAVASSELAVDGCDRLEVLHAAAPGNRFTRHDHRQCLAVLSAALSTHATDQRRDSFRLTFSHQLALPPGDDVTPWLNIFASYGIANPALPAAGLATLTLSVPGDLTEAWALTPHSRDEAYFATMCRVSRTVQASMRRWVPALYLNSIERYRTPSAILALLAWRCSHPYSGIKKSQFCWDAMDTSSVDRALHSAGHALPGAIRSVEKRLLDAGLAEVADYYVERETHLTLAQILRQRRHITALLAADAFFIEELLRLADCARELSSISAARPVLATRNLARYSGQIVRSLRRALRSLFAGEDFSPLGALLLVEGTAALTGSPIAATLGIETSEGIRIYQNEATLRG